MVQRLLEPGEIESLDHTAIPRLLLPRPGELYAARAERLRQLAQNNIKGIPVDEALASYVNVMAELVQEHALEVDLVEGTSHLLSSQVDEQAGRVLARSMRRLGTEVYTHTRAVRLTDEGLRLDNGFTLPADLVVLTAGGRPATAIAKRAGLFVRRGVVVDAQLDNESGLELVAHALHDQIVPAAVVVCSVPNTR